MPAPPPAADSLWYKDAVIYQLHVKAFFDGNNDGIGDFPGLTQKLDYLRDLGVTALWLLPFYPSPLRDDGYDIADYRAINPAYGTMEDFRAFIAAAKARGLRVITELVINHTSDQHDWFQRARRAPPGSPERDFYVWSDSDEKFAGTRIIFLDTEKSNWTWDPVAKAYYWHRFYSHQPDLNFDHPAVVAEVISVMRYWLDLGVDGMRLDAVPYLIEREGTNNENLPETHAVLKTLRRSLDEHYGDRMLLAEANQWPEDVLQYFGNGDECHMAFHFPLMPRIFMAVATEDRHPVTDIMRQTPDLPANCQWAIFLRNHDELTLEMVTDRERDYLWNHYATDKRMRLNLGIRRRLAPLMENDRRRLELLNGLMFSMPGTPAMYYGDEIGMGDNIFLGDRDGVRTPMQWSLDRNGGFSRADPAQLFLPLIMDPVYGYQSVNVEAQLRLPSSNLNWMKRLIAVRKARKAFGRGDLRFIYPTNRRVLAYLRSYEDETLLCVFNLARSPQAVELDLAAFKGRIPVELGGQSNFPPIGDLPYLLTMPGYAFFWFLLDPKPAAEPGWRGPVVQPDLVTLVMPDGWAGLLQRHNRRQLETEILPVFLPTQRWFSAKDRQTAGATVVGHAELGAALLTVVEVALREGEKQLYGLPLAVRWDQTDPEGVASLLPYTIAQARRARAEGVLYDAAADPALALDLVEAMRAERRVPVAEGGAIVFARTTALVERPLPGAPSVKRIGGEQSNTSLLIEEYAVLKLYRRLSIGPSTEVEMTRYLTEVAHFPNTPPLLGHFDWIGGPAGDRPLGILFAAVRNQGEAWSQALNYLDRYLDPALVMAPGATKPAEAPPPAAAAPPSAEHTAHALYLELAAKLGQRTGELHAALCPAGPAPPEFAPEPVSPGDLRAWEERALATARAALAALEARASALPEAARTLAAELLARRATVERLLTQLLPRTLEAQKTRVHGDYHLGQILVIQNDYAIIDFEAEPLRPMTERRAKSSPLLDVAGLLRSFAYASATVAHRMAEMQPTAQAALATRAEEWRREVCAAFLTSYFQTMAGVASLPGPREVEALLHFFALEKALYEVSYELANRPTWVDIPLSGVLRLCEGGPGELGPARAGVPEQPR